MTVVARCLSFVAGGFLGGCAVGLVAFLLGVKAMEAEERDEGWTT